MEYTRQQHEKFLDEELKAISEKYIETITKSAISLMDSGEVFVSQFMKIDANGQAILKMRNSRGLPRKKDYYCCVLLIGEMSKYKNWGNISWAELRKNYQKEFSEVTCVWHSKSDDNFSLVGVKGLSFELANMLVPNCLLVLGPQEPPVEYYGNLIELIRAEENESETGRMLFSNKLLHKWAPSKLSGLHNNASFIAGQLELTDEVVIQGPPGTGKTYKMAELCSLLLLKNKSVLVTAFTNRALMELASKDALQPFLEKSLVHKTNLTTDESKEMPKLLKADSSEIQCSLGELTLATFYISSGWSVMVSDSPPFDYVIMDEASQALFAMICACKKLAKKVIWIGDQCQLPPIINMNVDTLFEKGYEHLSTGFSTLCNYFAFPSYVLNDTFRLTSRAASFTSLFYSIPLNSVAEKRTILKLPFFNQNGGPTNIKLHLSPGDRTPKVAIEKIMQIIHQILDKNPELEIAVLTKFRATVKSLQKSFVSIFGEIDNVIIDTVERVQGLTCDICIYLIPNDLCYMSLEKSLFNVATSRSRLNTIIVFDENMLVDASMPSEVRDYLEKIDIGF